MVKGQITPETVDEWSNYLDLPLRASFLERCAESNNQAIGDALISFFATWRTSLMHSSMATLEAIALDERLGPLVKTIIIQDDCAKCDPYVASTVPSQDNLYDIWPRCDAGTVDIGRIDFARLMVILRENRLRPEVIKIREYQIFPRNLDFCPETRHARDTYKDLVFNGHGLVSAAALAREIIEHCSLAVTSFVIGFALVSDETNSFYGLPHLHHYALRLGVRNPTVYDAVITLSPEQQGQKVGFSRLRSADIDLGHEEMAYWLQRAFYEAASLENLTLHKLGSQMPAIFDARVAPHLNEFVLKHTKISDDKLFTMLSRSKRSLKRLVFSSVTLEEGSSWCELLPALARSFPGLTSFSLDRLAENHQKLTHIAFHDLQDNDLPDDCRSGLDMKVRVHAGVGRRLIRFGYDGSNAGKVLNIAGKFLAENKPSSSGKGG